MATVTSETNPASVAAAAPETGKRGEVLRRPPVLKETPVEAPARAALPAARVPSRRQPLIFGAAAKAPEFSDRMRYHYRETRRMNVEIPCTVEVVEADGTVYDAGTATVLNVSPSGALVSDFELERKSFPSSSFKIRMVLKGEPYTGIGIEATPVRIAEGGGLGLKFNEIFVAV
jgi:hypothetical protein